MKEAPTAHGPQGSVGSEGGDSGVCMCVCVCVRVGSYWSSNQNIRYTPTPPPQQVHYKATKRVQLALDHTAPLQDAEEQVESGVSWGCWMGAGGSVLEETSAGPCVWPLPQQKEPTPETPEGLSSSTPLSLSRPWTSVLTPIGLHSQTRCETRRPGPSCVVLEVSGKGFRDGSCRWRSSEASP